MALHPYFKLSGIEPGKVITARFGAIDFRMPVSFEILKALFDEGFPYLKLTPEGRHALLNKSMDELSISLPLENAKILQTKKTASKSNKKYNAGKSTKMDC
jgi:hypothetical protein